jgi:hypothetical protein
LEWALRLRGFLQLLSAQHLRDVMRRQPLVTTRALSGQADFQFSAEMRHAENLERVSADDRAT